MNAIESIVKRSWTAGLDDGIAFFRGMRTMNNEGLSEYLLPEMNQTCHCGGMRVSA